MNEDQIREDWKAKRHGLSMHGYLSDKDICDYFLAIIKADRDALRVRLEGAKITHHLMQDGVSNDFGYVEGYNDALAAISKTFETI
jgi:hypothetical protein